MTTNRNIPKETTRDLVAHNPVWPSVLNHLEQSIADNDAMGRLLAELSILEPLDVSFPDVDEDMLTPDDVKL